jgi:hypothetical protein
MKVINLYFSCFSLAGILLPAVSLSNDLEQSNTEKSNFESSNSINDYQNNISQLEINAGPHSKELITPLVSLGVLQNENNQYYDAENSFKSALNIHRINNGLHDLSQLPILELIISNNISQQKWKAANNNYHLYYWVHNRNYEKTDPKMLTVIDKLIAWHLLGTNLEAGPHPGEHFIKLLELNKRALHIVENFPAQDDLELAKRLYKLALIHYYIAIAVQGGKPIGQYLVQKFNPIQKGESYETTTEKIVRKRYRLSRKLIRRIASIYEDNASAASSSEAIALVYLADWDLLFSRRSNAKRGYHLAYSKLIENGFSREIVNSFFLQPKLLPKSEFFPDLMLKHASIKNPVDKTTDNTDSTETVDTAMEFIGWSTALPGVKFPAAEINSIVSASTERYSLVSFDVLKDGLTENIRISREKPENSLPRRVTYDAIWSAQYRPRLLDGKAVAVSGMSARFYLPSIE